MNNLVQPQQSDIPEARLTIGPKIDINNFVGANIPDAYLQNSN